MTYRQALRCVAFTTTLLLGSFGANADEGDGNGCSDAKECLAAGLRLSQSGDHAAALSDFQRAYHLEPSRLLLYHIASAYKSMGKPVEAEDAFDKVLSDTGPLKPEYLKQARAAKQEQKAKIGFVDVKANVGGVIEIDGERRGEAPLQKPLRAAAGEHEVSVTAPGYLTAKQTATVVARNRTDLVFELQPDPAKLARVTIASPLSGAEVRVDDQLVGVTPLAAPLKLPAGKHSIELRRAGYMDGYREVTLAPGAGITVAFNPDEDESDDADRGRLVIAAGGLTGVRVTIDGRVRGVYRKPMPLPAGPHLVSLDRPGYEPIERKVEVRAEGDTRLDVSFQPAQAMREAEAARVGTRHSWAYAAIITGAVVAAGSAGLIVWGQSQLPSAEDKLSLVKKDAAPGSGADCDPTRLNKISAPLCQEKMSSAQNTVDKYRNLRLAGIIGASAGVALVAVGVVLRLVQPDSAQKAPKEALLDFAEPVLSAGPYGATLGLRGRF